MSIKSILRNASGQITSCLDSSSSYEFEYNASNKISLVKRSDLSGGNSKFLTLNYDQNGNVSSIDSNIQDGSAIEKTNHVRFRDLLSILTTIQYWSDGVSIMPAPSGVSVTKGSCSVVTANGAKLWTGLHLLDDINAARHEIFQYALENLPAIVDYGPGKYKIIGGMTIEMLASSGELLIRGVKGQTRFEFSGDFKYDNIGTPMPTQTTVCNTGATINTGFNDWFSFRIRQLGLSGTAPASDDLYMQRIGYVGLLASDPQPWLHATTEETHGFNIQHTRFAYVKCDVDQMGDEGIELDYCIDSLIDTPTIRRANFTGENGGGGVSIKNGCRRVTVLAPTVVDNLPDEWTAGTYALAQRTIVGSQIYKSAIDNNTSAPPTNWTAINPANKGISVKIITAHTVEDVTIIAPIVKRVHDAFLYVGATGAGAKNIKVIGGSGVSSLVAGFKTSGSFNVDNVDIDFNMSDVKEIVWDTLAPGVKGRLKTECENVLLDNPDTITADLGQTTNYEIQGSYKNLGGRICQFHGSIGGNNGIRYASFDNCGPSTNITAIDSFGSTHNGFYVLDSDFTDCRANTTANIFIRYADKVKRCSVGLSISNGGSTKPYQAIQNCIDVSDVTTINGGVVWKDPATGGKPPNWHDIDINFNIGLNGTTEAPLLFNPSAVITGARLQNITVNNSVNLGAGKNAVIGANATKTWLTGLSTLNCISPGFTDSGVTTLLADNQ